MSRSGRAIFLSYASQDADAAKRIRDALASAGLEVWLDQGELRGGDAWDASIRSRIKECALFLPVISANTEARSEGYFRLEWKLAVDRTHLMADDEAFLLPVVIDATPEASARVPDAFRARQWVRLPQGQPSAEFVARVRKLMDTPRDAVGNGGAPAQGRHALPKSPSRTLVAAVAAAALVLAAWFAYYALGTVPRPVAQSPSILRPPAAAANSASIAVLPFANLSDDKGNEYFSDGISEELLTVLQKLPGLHVAARSSSFSFKGSGATAQEIGHKLGVAHLIEGSVRRSGGTVRIVARLNRTANGAQVWSDAYTRDLTDVFALQAELAQAIVEQLRGHLGSELSASGKADLRAQIEAAAKGTTRNAEAHQLYLEGLSYHHRGGPDNTRRAIALLQRSVALDPSFALAWAALSRAGWTLGANASDTREYQEGFGLAQQAAHRAIQLEPELASGWLARAGTQLAYEFNWKGAAESLARAQRLAPGDGDILYSAAQLAYAFGQPEKAMQLSKRGVSVDPLSTRHRVRLGFALESLGRYEEAQAQFQRVTELSPTSPYAHAGVALMLMRRQRLEEAFREVKLAPVAWERLTVESQVLWALGRKTESDAALQRLIDTLADVAAYQVAQVYAHRRNKDRAFEWLERSAKQRDPGVALLRSDVTFTTLYDDPRWLAFLRKIGLTDEQLK